MSSYLGRLTSLERRFVVGVMVVVFLVLNLLFVWPRFADWSKAKQRLVEAQKTLNVFQVEITQKTNYQAQVTSMESEGETVLPEDQAIEFLRTIQAQASQSGVTVNNTARQTTRTDQFFQEQAQYITTVSGEKQLVDFLYNLSSRSSMIRVRGLSVQPEPQHYQLSANITLVASYQKKPPSPHAAASVPAPAAKSTATQTNAAPAKPAVTQTNAAPARTAPTPKNAPTPGKTAPATNAPRPAKSNPTPKSATPAKTASPTDKRL